MKYPEGAIQTFTGKFITPLDPKVEQIDIIDIAHALGNMCRYAGHTRTFYSVAEHCILASWYIDEPLLRMNHEYALEALLHDATEAYLVDVPRPIKYLMPDYIAYEAKLQAVIDEKFHLKPHTKELKEVDSRLLVSESRILFDAGIDIEGVQPYPNFELFHLSPKHTKKAFLERFEYLMSKRGI